MAIFTKPDGFVKQICIYLSKTDYEQAYALAQEMASAFPNEMIAYFLLAKSALRLERYDGALRHALKAFNLSSDRKDLRASALIAASSYFMLGRFEDGARMLRDFEQDQDEDVERLLLIFASVMGDEVSAAKYANELMKLNKKSAEETIVRFLEEK